MLLKKLLTSVTGSFLLPKQFVEDKKAITEYINECNDRLKIDSCIAMIKLLNSEYSDKVNKATLDSVISQLHLLRIKRKMQLSPKVQYNYR